MILIDDLGWADLACYGSTFHETPNLDRLASQGMRFTDAYAACPVCSPTRASLMTGKYPARLNLTDWIPGRKSRPDEQLLAPAFDQQLPLEEVTIAQALRPAGYVSASIGKWHLGGPSYYPERHGFDLNVGGTHRGSPRSYFYPDWDNDPPISGRPGDYLTDRLSDEAERFMEAHRDRPFFLYLSHYAVHIPLQAKKDWISVYEGSRRRGQKQSNPIYAAMIHSVDESVGRIVNKLDALGIAQNTVIFFTSDNGGLSVKEGPNTPATSNAPLRAGKGHVYEGGIREPLLVRWPGVIRAGSSSSVPVSSIDFYPTILELAGISTQPNQAIDGLSIVHLLEQKGDIRRSALFWHYPHYSNQGGKPSGAVRQGDFKLIEFYEDGRLELYNLKDDIGEQRNLASAMPSKTKALYKMLVDWRKAMGAKMPTPNPGYDPSKVAATDFP